MCEHSYCNLPWNGLSNREVCVSAVIVGGLCGYFLFFWGLQISVGIHPVHPRPVADVSSCCQTNCEGPGRALPGLVLPRLRGIMGGRTCPTAWSAAGAELKTELTQFITQLWCKCRLQIKSLSEFWTFSQRGCYKRLRLTVSEPEQQLKAAVCGTRVPFVSDYCPFINRSVT